ncbi:unnamed protein product [Protopolystoma xenopodis]|uniref:Uncharacterized protein n=1 Tax=Protopolystoma xenopodis TaxID=117903 RepID=A0A448XQ65_9PLAT|nr:unnamed protein product [Protopolystoma xenopodis]
MPHKQLELASWSISRLAGPHASTARQQAPTTLLPALISGGSVGLFTGAGVGSDDADSRGGASCRLAVSLPWGTQTLAMTLAQNWGMEQTCRVRLRVCFRGLDISTDKIVLVSAS